MNPAPVHIGVDVSKQSLDCAWPDRPQSYPNSPRGIASLIRQCLLSPAPVCLCCEASGGYEQPLVIAALNAGIRIARVNPKRVRDFARSKGLIAKTDAIDARLLAEYSTTVQPRLLPARCQHQQALRELVDRRQQLLGMLEAESCRLDQSRDPFILRSLRRSLRTLRTWIQACEKQIHTLIGATPALKAAFDRLILPKGVGPCTAWAVLAYMPELGSLDRKEAAALAGIAPFNDDSGQHRGKRYIQGGRFLLRRSLYMAALVSSRHNPILRSFYRRLVDAGKPKKAALIAVCRKLVVLLNRILQDPNFSPA